MRYADNIIPVFEFLVSHMTPVIEIDSIEVDGDNWKLNVCRTRWVRSRKTLVIGGLDYKVISFVKDDHIIVSGPSIPVVTSFQLSQPIFRHGSSKKVNAEFGGAADLRQEMVYLPRPYVEEDNRWDSDIAYLARVKPLFLCDFNTEKDNTDNQQVDSIEPMNEMADVFFEVIEANDDLFNKPLNIGAEEWMNFGNPGIWGNDKLIFNQNLSGVERKFNLEVLHDGACKCEDMAVVTCAPVAFYLNTVFKKEIASGENFEVTLIDTDGNPVVGVFNVLTNELVVPAAGGAINFDVNSVPFYVGVTTDQNLPVKNSTGAIDVGGKVGAHWRIGDSHVELKDQLGNILYTINVYAEQTTDFVIADSSETFNGVPVSGVVPEGNKDVTAKNSVGTNVGVVTNDTPTNLDIEIPDNTNTFQGDPTESTPSGQNKSVQTVNTNSDPVGVAEVDTPNAIVIRIGVSQIEINNSIGANLYTIDIPAEGAAVQVISDSSVAVKDSAGTTIYTVSVKAQGTANQVVADSTVAVKDSAGTTIYTTTVKAANSAIQVVADSSVLVKNSAGVTLYTVSVKAANTANQTVNDSTVNVKNSAGTLLHATTVVAQGSADQIVSNSTVLLKDNLGNTLDTVSVLAEGSTNKNISDFATKKVYYNRPFIQNCVSFHNYDEGWMYANNYDPPFHPTDGVLQRLDLTVSPDYLKYNNAFGHKFRLTGINGGYYDFNTASYKTVSGAASTFAAEFQTPVGVSGSAGGYVIDHLTGIAWSTHRGGSGGVTWDNMWLNGVTFMTFSDWYIPTMSYILTLLRLDLLTNLGVGRPPFQWDQPQGWLNNTQINATINAYRFDSVSGAVTVAIKTSSGTANKIYSRLHYARTAYVLQP